ncbi:AI-2E family transporter [Oceanicella sp. SM1341]|uniref:AI-2E family transporter n=1 Tax=Oceanicella sp. SM1341 TaxID=1548889 RepID=UPI0013004B55|nr:AI-2E family transporter [Oceanicella sp. SM1341]
MKYLARLVDLAPVGLFIIALLATLQVAQEVFAPVLLAIMVGIVLSPLADWLRKRHLSDAAVALILLIAGLTFLALVITALATPVSELVEQWPSIWSRLQLVLIDVRSALSSLQTVQERLTAAMNDENQMTVQLDGGGGVGFALTYAPALVAQTLVFVGALFFFLLTRKSIYNTIAQMGRTKEERVHLAEILADAEGRVSRYFLSISVINACLGTMVALIMAVLGMPFAMVWGLVAAALNYVLYVGPALFTGMLLIGGVIHFTGLYALLPAASFLCLNLLEGQFITPAIIGRTMTVNPLLVFISLVFWIWLWGPIGGIISIPLLLVITALVSAGERRRTLPEPIVEEA